MGLVLNEKDWPTARTICRKCGEVIIYFVYLRGNSGELRPVPKVHNGWCKSRAAIDRAERTIKKYETKRGGISADNTTIRVEEPVAPPTPKPLERRAGMKCNKILYVSAPKLATPKAINKVAKDCGLDVDLNAAGQYTVLHKEKPIYRTIKVRSVFYFLLLNYANLAGGGNIITGPLIAEKTEKKAKAPKKVKAPRKSAKK